MGIAITLLSKVLKTKILPWWLTGQPSKKQIELFENYCGHSPYNITRYNVGVMDGWVEPFEDTMGNDVIRIYPSEIRDWLSM
jgi:hypothetical protein